MGDLASREVWRVTDNEGCDREYFPHWSPDGTQLTYMRIQWTPETGTTGTAVFVIDAEGTNERQLTEWETMAGDPDWSPDGEWIVYGTYPLGEFNFVPAVSNLYRMHPDGTGTEQLTFNEDTTQRATQPRYTPDGESVVFTAVVPAGREIWVMPAAGGEPTVVAEGGIHTHPTWQPAPAALAARLPAAQATPDAPVIEGVFDVDGHGLYLQLIRGLRGGPGGRQR
jgi:Tol biopolymer transport system component